MTWPLGAAMFVTDFRKFGKYFNSPIMVTVFSWQCLILLMTVSAASTETPGGEKNPESTVTIAVLIRNKAFVLPWFLGHIEKLDYPKHRISLWLRCDHNSDNSTAILEEWLSAVTPLYNVVDYFRRPLLQQSYPGEKSCHDWTEKRFEKIISLRQEALEAARLRRSDFLFMLDADVILENARTLQILMAEKKTVIAPLLTCPTDEMYYNYSNFWAATSDVGYHAPSDDYLPIFERRRIGCFSVPMIHTAVLINLQDELSKHFSYSQPYDDVAQDDIIIFANTVQSFGVTLNVINTERFGTVEPSLNEHYSLDFSKDAFVFTKTEAINRGTSLYQSPHVSVPPVVRHTLGVDKIYVINMPQHKGRRKRMSQSMRELGLRFTFWDGYDGQARSGWGRMHKPDMRKALSVADMQKWGVEELPTYEDPIENRPLQKHEIGCFLSHYTIWKEIVRNGYERVIIFEDSVRFFVHFPNRVSAAINEADDLVSNWDLLYLTRKDVSFELEKAVSGAESLVYPNYSYWASSYVLTLTGAEKLVEQKPLEKMIPVDDFLSVMFDKHPSDEVKSAFYPRDLIALSVDPVSAEPVFKEKDDWMQGDDGVVGGERSPAYYKVVPQSVCTSRKCDNGDL